MSARGILIAALAIGLVVGLGTAPSGVRSARAATDGARPVATASRMALGAMAQIRADENLAVEVVVDIRNRERNEVARNFLATPSRVTRFAHGNELVIPFDDLVSPYRAIVAMRLFTEDAFTTRGVEHVVAFDGETLARIAEFYTGNARNAARIKSSGAVGDVSITRDHRILVSIARREVDDLRALAQAVLKEPSRITRMVEGEEIVIPIDAMKDAYRAAALAHLFHRDTIREDARRHGVVLGVESMFRIALWFTGDGNNWARLKEASHKRQDAVDLGETVVIPRTLLGSWAMLTEDDVIAETKDFPIAFTSRSRREVAIMPGQRLTIPRSVLASWTRFMEGGEDSAQDAVDWYVYRGLTNGPLTYGADERGGYAQYRLREGEALYSSVVVRFTGVMAATEVLQLADKVLRRSDYRDPRRLPVNARIKIPMALLTPEWRPQGDPSREAESEEKTAVARIEEVIEQERAEERRVTPPPTDRRPLAGVTVILDAGHGGRDPGAIGSSGLAENEIVYDVLCRVRRILTETTAATVYETIEDRKTGYTPSNERIIRDNREEHLRTTPRYMNDDVVVSANLRWYLANACVRDAVDEGRDLDRTVFTSFHADALHSSVRGTMIYIPSARHCAGRYNPAPSYRIYREVRVRPTVSYSQNDRLRSQAMSQQFAERVLAKLGEYDVACHTQNAIRGYVVRASGSRAWVPAVIRYNATPMKLLVEIGNLRNAHDAANMENPAWREKFAKAYVDALVAQFRE